MKQFLTVCLMLALGIGCKQPAPDSHAHNADGSHPEEGPAAISYTQYSKQSELFVEFKPLIVGKTSSFATHLTVLGEVFKPLTRGKVTLSLIINGKGIR
ncbi:hypothetical protein MD537_18715, partial [Flavihumibacter sediminis]|nr:hypothetical protein [Flavihumibacter sediminis]